LLWSLFLFSAASALLLPSGGAAVVGSVDGGGMAVVTGVRHGSSSSSCRGAGCCLFSSGVFVFSSLCFSFKRALSRPKKIPPAAGVESSIYRLEGERAAVARGEQGSAEVGWAVGAAGKARLPWFLVIQGRGASGLGRARGAPEFMKNEECLPFPCCTSRGRRKKNSVVQNDTVLLCSKQWASFLYIYIYILFLLILFV
jgi:hypothetical protein